MFWTLWLMATLKHKSCQRIDCWSNDFESKDCRAMVCGSNHFWWKECRWDVSRSNDWRLYDNWPNDSDLVVDCWQIDIRSNGCRSNDAKPPLESCFKCFHINCISWDARNSKQLNNEENVCLQTSWIRIFAKFYSECFVVTDIEGTHLKTGNFLHKIKN